MTQALAIQHTTPTDSEFQIMLTQSEMLIKTGFLPQAIKTKEQALAIILTGRELGIPSMAALNTINVIQGKPTVSPQLMLALIERSGQLENIEIKNGNDSVSCTMKRKNHSAHTEVFGKSEASALNLIGKDNYKKQPLTMYRWRAVASCARVVFPDVILGLYTPDEMGADVNTDGEMLKDIPDNVSKFPSKIEEDLRRAQYEVYHEEKGLAIETDPRENWTDENLKEFKAICEKLKEYADFIGYSPATVKKMVDKMVSFETLGECWDALEKVAIENYEKKYDAISKGLTAQNWDDDEKEVYLSKFDVTVLGDATREQLDEIYADMVKDKMI